MSSTDLMVQLFFLYIDQEDPPDILSREYLSADCIIIRFEWFYGKVKDYGYTKDRYNNIWKIFNNYWKGKRL